MFRHLNKVLCLFLFTSIVVFTNCKTDPKTSTTSTSNATNTTVSVGMITEPDAVHPILSRTRYGRTVYSHVFKSLLQNDPRDGKLVPFVAKAQPEIKTVEEGEFKGGKSYTYEIRPEAVWGDGKPVLASDYLFTMKAIFNPNVKTAWVSLLTFIGDIQIDPNNPKRFTVYTSSCQIREDEALATAQFYPEHLYDPKGLMKSISFRDLADESKAKELKENAQLKEFATSFGAPERLREPSSIHGSGPYKLTSFKTKDEVVLEKKENWWGDQFADKEPIFTAIPKKIIYKIVPDMTTASAMLKDGELDIMGEMTPTDYNGLKQNKVGQEKLNFESPAVPVIYFCYLNTKSPKLSDKRVRRALTHLIDMDKYIEDNMFGTAIRVNNPFPPHRPYYNKSLPMPQVDIEKAKALLDDAGWIDANEDGVREKVVNGKKMDLKIEIKSRPKSETANAIAALLKSTAKKAGVQIDLIHKESNAIRKQDIPAGDYDIIVGGIGFTPSRYDDLTPYLHTKGFASAGGRNIANFGNAKSDALLEAITTNCTDDAARNKAYTQLQEIVYDECPFLYIMSNNARIAVSNRFEKTMISKIRPGYFENYFVAK